MVRMLYAMNWTLDDTLLMMYVTYKASNFNVRFSVRREHQRFRSGIKILLIELASSSLSENFPIMTSPDCKRMARSRLATPWLLI